MMAAAILLTMLAAGCREKPPSDPELTRISKPVPGMLPYFRGTIMDPYWPENNRLPDDLRRMGTITLVDHSGKANAKSDRDGRYALVTFFYTSCSGICPMITNSMKELSSQIPDQSDLAFLSITVDPDVDKPEKIKAYRADHRIIRDNWIFLTGPKSDIAALARQQFAAEIEARSSRTDLLDFVHTENLFLLDKEGYLRGIYRARGNGDFPRLLEDLKTLRSERRS